MTKAYLVAMPTIKDNDMFAKEYQPVKKIRLDNSISNAIIIKGA